MTRVPRAGLSMRLLSGSTRLAGYFCDVATWESSLHGLVSFCSRRVVLLPQTQEVEKPCHRWRFVVQRVAGGCRPEVLFHEHKLFGS